MGVPPIASLISKSENAQEKLALETWEHSKTSMNYIVREFDHFVKAQDDIYEEVVAELSNGKKTSHWMWFIFPQLKGLGKSAMAERYAIDSVEQARRYWEHPLLGKRLINCTQLVIHVQNRTVDEIFGSPDNLKFHSSMTLFAVAIPDEPVFKLALEQYFAGRHDLKTIELLR